MKNYTVPAFIGGFICACVLTCPNGQSVTKPKSGNFDSTTPLQQAVIVTKGKPYPITKWRDKPMPNYGQLFDRYEKQIDSAANAYAELDAAFQRANDSLQAELYKQQITPRVFEQTKEDDNVKITASGVVMGTITTMGINYTVKPQKCPQTRYFYGGAGVLNGSPTLNASFQIGRFQANGLIGQGAYGVGVLWGF